MKKWEYDIALLKELADPDHYALRQELNRKGEQGWEVVGFLPIPSSESGVILVKREIEKV